MLRLLVFAVLLEVVETTFRQNVLESPGTSGKPVNTVSYHCLRVRAKQIMFQQQCFQRWTNKETLKGNIVFPGLLSDCSLHTKVGLNVNANKS